MKTSIKASECSLGMSITSSEISVYQVDPRSGEMVAQKQVSAPAADDLLATLNQLVQSVAATSAATGLAVADPAVQVRLSAVARGVDSLDNHQSWLANATIVSCQSALSAAVEHQFPRAKSIAIAHLDESGRVDAAQPLILVEPATEWITSTGKTLDGSHAVTERLGAEALSSAIRSLPVRTQPVDLVVLAGAGAEMLDAGPELRHAFAVPVEIATAGRYAAAHGAALLAQNRSAPSSIGGPPIVIGPRKALALVAMGGLIAAAVTFFVDGDTDDETPTKADKAVSSSLGYQPTFSDF